MVVSPDVEERYVRSSSANLSRLRELTFHPLILNIEHLFYPFFAPRKHERHRKSVYSYYLVCNKY